MQGLADFSMVTVTLGRYGGPADLHRGDRLRRKPTVRGGPTPQGPPLTVPPRQPSSYRRSRGRATRLPPPDSGAARSFGLFTVRREPMEERRRLDDDTARSFLAVAVEEARAGLAEGGIPIGAALFQRDGTLLGRGHNRRLQDGDPSVHAETDAFRKAGRRRDYPDCVMVTTLSPCWYCSGLVRQFGIGGLVIGEATTFSGGHEWLRDVGVDVVLLDDAECRSLLGDFVAEHPDLWHEDIGVPE